MAALDGRKNGLVASSWPIVVGSDGRPFAAFSATSAARA